MTQLFHDNLTIFFRREQFHDRRLDQRNQGHVRIRRYRDRTQEFRSQFRSQVNRSRAVGAADNTDRSCLRSGKTQEHRATQGNEYTDLCRRAEQESFRVRKQRTEVRHRTDTHKDQRRENFKLNARMNEGKNAFFKAVFRQVGKDTTECDRSEQQWLEFLGKCQVEQQYADKDHDGVTDGKDDQAAVMPYRSHRYYEISHSVSPLLCFLVS